MLSIAPISDAVLRDEWLRIAEQILAHFGCENSVAEIGRCIDCWKKDPCVPAEEMLDALGFALGERLVTQHGGRWVS